MQADTPTSRPSIEAWVRNYIVTSFLSGAEAASLRNDDDLLMVLDSLQILRMVVALEPSFGIKVENSDLTADNLASVEKIAQFIIRKQADRQPASQVPSDKT
jgi:acyl carrier protein